MEITVSKIAAKEQLTTHYEAFQEEYKQQLEGWKVAMDKFANGIRDYGASIVAERPIEPPKPQDFSQQYEDLLAMVDANVTDDISLGEDDFNRIYLDRFHWRHIFAQNSATYGSATYGSSDW